MADLQKTSQVITEVATQNVGKQKTSQVIVEVATVNTGLSQFDTFVTPTSDFDTSIPVDTTYGVTYNTDNEPMIWSMDLRKRVNTRTQHFPCGHWHKRKAIGHAEPDYFSNPSTQGRCVYPSVQYNTPYMYVLEIDPRNGTLGEFPPQTTSVIKIDLSQSPPVALERLVLGSEYYGTFDGGRLDPAQIGPWCINKEGTRLFYVLRHYDYHWVAGYTDSKNAELVEVDITGTYMVTVKITMFTSLFSVNTENAIDMCANNHYVFILTNSGKIIKVSAGGHAIVDTLSVGTGVKTFDIDREWNRIFFCDYLGDWVYPSSYYYRYDTDFNLESKWTYYGVKNLIREVNNWLVMDCVHFNFPNVDKLHRCGRDWTVSPSGASVALSNVSFLQQIFDIRSEKLYLLNMQNDMSGHNYLYCLYAPDDLSDATDMTVAGTKDISYWAGHGYGLSFDWCWSSMAVMDALGTVIAHLRYKEDSVNTGLNGLYYNWLATFSADSSFTELTDSAIEYPSFSHY